MNGRTWKITAGIISFLLVICGTLVSLIYSVHSAADIKDREDIQTLTVELSVLHEGQKGIKEDLRRVSKDVSDIKNYLLRGKLP